MRRLNLALAALIRSLAGIPDLPPRVLDALDEVQQAMAALGYEDLGPIPR